LNYKAFSSTSSVFGVLLERTSVFSTKLVLLNFLTELLAVPYEIVSSSSTLALLLGFDRLKPQILVDSALRF
jgi:hypothetical protein